MSNWFTVDHIDEDTFVISEPKHWEETHCYLVCGRERAVLIDTGLGVADIAEAVSSLTPLPVFAVLTHTHTGIISEVCAAFRSLPFTQRKQHGSRKSFPFRSLPSDDSSSADRAAFLRNSIRINIPYFMGMRTDCFMTAIDWSLAGGVSLFCTRRDILPDIVVSMMRRENTYFQEI